MAESTSTQNHGSVALGFDRKDILDHAPISISTSTCPTYPAILSSS